MPGIPAGANREAWLRTFKPVPVRQHLASEGRFSHMITDTPVNAPYVSTGNLPSAEHVRLLVNKAYERFRANAEGELSHVYPSLAAVDPDRFGICVANTRGLTADAGDADVEFTIMSVAKPFVFALMCGFPP